MTKSAGKVPFPDVVAHHSGPCPVTGHGDAFHTATVERGVDASTYFAESGISELAAQNGGICTFWLGEILALYQNTNRPLAADDELAPSLNANADLFGSFMGSLSASDPVRSAKRAVVERVLGNANFVNALDDAVIDGASIYLASIEGQTLPLDEFAIHLIAHVNSGLPGVLDFNEKPLTAYLASETYGRVARHFFEIASEVISKVHSAANTNADLVVDMIRDILEANFASIAAAPATNMVRTMFAQWGRPFSRDAIGDLSPEELKELGTIIIAIYDTTSLSLLWAIAYIETHSNERRRFIEALESGDDPFGAASLLVLEAVRLGGSNPTALWREVITPVSIEHSGATVIVPAQTMLWLDRRAANRDPSVFPNREEFDVANIRHIMKVPDENTISILARNRYEINSFNMVNTHRSPRKCPGRLFSMREQALLLVELYGRYEFSVSDTDVALAPYSSMPRPKSPGTIRIRMKS